MLAQCLHFGRQIERAMLAQRLHFVSTLSVRYLRGACMVNCTMIIRWLRIACAIVHIGGYIEKAVLVYMCTATAAACVYRIGRTDRVVESDFLMGFPMDFPMDFLMDFLMEKTNSRFSTFYQHVLL